ncbi:hypothetical protein GOODEAATRI_021100, partial [Goodea atripinnis]
LCHPFVRSLVMILSPSEKLSFSIAQPHSSRLSLSVEEPGPHRTAHVQLLPFLRPSVLVMECSADVSLTSAETLPRVFASVSTNLRYILFIFCRYNLFIVLYPLGVVGELLTIYTALPFVRRSGMYSMRLPNKYNVSFDYYYFLIIVMLSYIPRKEKCLSYACIRWFVNVLKYVT